MTIPLAEATIFETTGSIHITCPKRMSAYLKKEVEELGFPIVETLVTGIETRGTAADCMRLNLNLRTAHRVLYFIKSFIAHDPEELYRQIKKVAWEQYLFEDVYFSVVSHADNETIRNTTFASLKCKDAIVDKLSEIYGKRPDTGPDKNHAVIYLHWKAEEASIYIDTSGENIAKHGYRKIPFRAPLQETLAAALIMASGWDKKTSFVNPMCGSGTLAIEAALMATERAPGLNRNNYGFMHVKGYDESVYQQLRTEIKNRALKKTVGRIIASDISEVAIEAAKNNAATAGVDHLIEFYTCDFRETPVPEGEGIVMLNPEYGERLGDEEELVAIYEAIGNFFKQKCKGYLGYIFTGNMLLAKKIGLKTKRKIEFYNSTIDCRLLEYELYSGSRRVRQVEPEQ
jgi:putative N6-adenine-specific DNA methylase